MGAETFSQVASGKTAAEAFRAAQEQARYDYGHAGYTGTIAEKHDFIDLTNRVHPDTLATAATRGWFEYVPNDPIWMAVDDKWGPAGCIKLDEGRYLFFGWASS